MAPRPKPLDERIDALTTSRHECLVWTGMMKDGKPYLKGVGNPARHLLNITDARIHVRLDCPLEDPRCIKPTHQRVVITQDNKYGDLPPVHWARATDNLSAQDVIEIEENLELLLADEITLEDLDGLPPHLKTEILRRMNP